MKRMAFVFMVAALFVLAACQPKRADGLYAQMATTRGTIVVSLAFDKAPMTVSNFVGLAEGTLAANGVKGKKFYDGLTFHRVEPNFVVQSGDPQGNGSGGPGYEFPNEIVPGLSHDAPGVMAMANAGPDTNGSQFYITMSPTPHLDGSYSIFGRVVQGMDVVGKIQVGDKIKSVKILRIGAAAKAFTVTQESFDALVAKAKAGVVEQAKAKREADLAEIARKWPVVTTTPSGLMYTVMKKGSGGSPANGAEVTVDYTGMFLDGSVFDSSVQRGQPATFKIGGVIQGWNEALMTMKKGEKRLLIIPPELGYGAKGYPGAIPPNSFLVFEVELIDFK